MFADGLCEDQILNDLRCLEDDDVTKCLRLAAEAVREREIPLLRSA